MTGDPAPAPPDEPVQAPLDSQETAATLRVQAGETAAYDLLVRRYMRSAFAVAYRLLGHREDAEDVVQEAFLAALANIRSFDPSRQFGPWLHRIVVTRGLNFRKSRSRRTTEALEDAANEWWDVIVRWRRVVAAASVAAMLVAGGLLWSAARDEPALMLGEDAAPEAVALAGLVAAYPDDAVFSSFIETAGQDEFTSWDER